ncbi:MAG: hypothetical protein ACRDA9_04360 [Plesiomonas shigelloides]
MASTDEVLDAELAKISIVKSAELTDLARDSSSLVDFQNIINNTSGQVNLVEAILENSKPHEITPEIAQFCDTTLIKAEVPLAPEDGPIPLEQAGCEALGFTLSPQQYKELRVAGCESFLGEAMSASARLVKRFSANMKDQYLLLTESVDSLQKRLNGLSDLLDETPTIRYGSSDIEIGYRLYNLFKANNKLNEDWAGNFNKVVGTLRALSGNYSRTYSDNLNDIFAFFGGFDGITKDDAEARLYSIPLYLNDIVFRECSFVNRELSTTAVQVKTSIVLMGESFFMNGIRNKRQAACLDIQDVTFFVDDLTKNNFITFTSHQEADYGKAPTVKCLGTNEIKNMIKLMNSAIIEVTKIHSGFDKLELGNTEYVNIVKAISRNEWDGFEETVLRNFETLVMNRHNDFANIRAKVTNYLILLINGLIELCKLSIESAKQIEG